MKSFYVALEWLTIFIQCNVIVDAVTKLPGMSHVAPDYLASVWVPLKKIKPVLHCVFFKPYNMLSICWIFRPVTDVISS
jgi:hypothetical protein